MTLLNQTGAVDAEVESAVVADVVAAARQILAGETESGSGDFGSLFEHAADEGIVAVNRRRLAAGDAAIPLDQAARLRSVAVARLRGLGGLAVLLADETVEDINCNGCDNVWVTRAGGTREQVGPVADSDEELIAAVQALASGAGLSDTERRFDRAAPALDLQLSDGSRLHAIRDVAHRPSVSIRRHRLVEASLDQLQAGGMFSSEISDLLRAAVAAGFNMTVSGPFASGKTTLVGALTALCPFEERIVTIEDARELGLHEDSRHGNVVALEVRPPNIEGEGGVSAWDLFHEALRMRPDRIIVGEVRGPEAAVMLDAMSTGTDGSLSTIHTSTSEGVFRKLKTHARKPPAGLDPETSADLIAGSLDLVIQLGLRGDRRWVTSIREVRGADGAMVLSNELYAPTGPDRTAQRDAPISAERAERLAEHGWAPPGQAAGRW
ncbi:Flp pilus assembly complex ATPase component TadA [Glycomyces sp. L485]|uniref:CpaF family protein n=1 Tax=Glycomyces sp. L485 TaxID=2909235 RepID=UPI001F4BB9BA|nr:ATPase, T2SS/T4P/T4SS family [Glycomyces sp. L485]MCH7229960.1 Flp pilus assembly complex ATPase component TadA [Glycomyces sp. L485]